jgi:TolB-like protein
VFLSYASQDAEAAKRICDALRAAGIEVWFDQSELRGGDVWDRQIRQQIHDCRLFMPIVSANTEAREEGYFRREWKLAVDRTLDLSERVAFLIPIVIDSTPEAKADVPDAFRHIQWTRLPDGNASSPFVERIRRLITPGPSSALPTGTAPPGYRTAQISTATNGPTRAARVALWTLSGVVALGLAYFVADRFWFPKRALAERPAAVPVTSPPAAMPAIPERSVAVLPFVDMSKKKDQEYFSDGLSEELIDQLAHSAELRVIARTSSFQFKGRNEDVRTIGQRLGVANLLEGSVRTSGKTMRVTAQLIKVSDGSHLWSETYDRDMGDIFKVQDSIAKAVVTSLQATMREHTNSSEHKSESTEAYAAYLRGLYFQYKYTEKDSWRSIEALRQAVRIDPGFAMAWAALARTYENEAIAGWMSPGKAHAEARGAVDHALGIDPNLAYAHAQLMAIEGNSFNFSAERAERIKVRELDPDDMTLLNDEAIEAANAGRFAESINLLKRAKERDPLNLRWLRYLWEQYMLASRLLEAEDTVHEILAINPGSVGAHCYLGYILLARSKLKEALATMREESDKETREECTAEALWASGHRTESDALLAKAKANYSGSDAFWIAVLYARRNDKDEAFNWLDHAYQNKEPVITAIGSVYEFRNLRDDPRFAAMLRRLN